ncbi:transcription elongation factor Elf1 like-domain-containing protein [Mortierella sp. GBAus27b]|nr:transcription elongation factor Elf1 like-domain-containing protein [Mortierella sp. GBAus27b]
MGKRKSARKPQAKEKKTLDTQFDCVACFHEKSISCKLDFDQKVGQLQCRMCGVSYTCTINYLSHAVDVYHDWIDACEAVNAAARASKSSAQDRNRDRDRDRDGERPRRSKPYDRHDDD